MIKTLFLLSLTILLNNATAQGQLNCSGVIIDTPIIITSGVRCGPGNLSLEVQVPVGTKANWYNDSIGGVLLRIGSNYFTTPVLTVNSAFYVEAVDKITGCISKRIAVNAKIDCGVGLNNSFAEKTKILIFPNPNNGQFQISISDYSKSDLLTFRIYDMYGRMIDVNSFSLLTGTSSKLMVLEMDKGIYQFNYCIGSTSGTEIIVIN